MPAFLNLDKGPRESVIYRQKFITEVKITHRWNLVSKVVEGWLVSRLLKELHVIVRAYPYKIKNKLRGETFYRIPACKHVFGFNSTVF